MAPFGPAFTFQLPITCADCVGIDRKATRQFARARKPLPRTHVAAQNGQHNLGHKLPINGDFAARGKPEPHE
jgi:hypothetical protein